MPLTPEEKAELDSLEKEQAADLKDIDSLLQVEDSLKAEIATEQGQTTPTEEPSAFESITKTVFPGSTQEAQRVQSEEERGIRSQLEAIETRALVPNRPQAEITADEEKKKELVFQLSETEGGKFKQAARTVLSSVGDVGSLLTRGLGSFKALITAEDGEGFEDAKTALQDPDEGILKGTREESRAFYDDLIAKTESPALKKSLTAVKFLAEASIGFLEDPTSIATGLGKVGTKIAGRVGRRSGPSIKASVAKTSGIQQEALEAASKEKLKDIRGAAGTELELADEITSRISPAGEKTLLEPLQVPKRKIERELTAEGAEVPLRQPTITEKQIKPLQGETVVRVPDPTQRLIDAKTGKDIDFPVDFLENVGKEKVFSTQFKEQFAKAADEAESIIKTTEGKPTISVPDALKMKREFQQVLSDKFGVEGKAVFDNILKGFSASVRSSIEQSAVKAGKPEYIDIMREISNSKEILKRSRQVLTGKKKGFDDLAASVAIEKKLNKIMNKFDREPAKVLEDLDEIFSKSGIPSDFANQANLAAIARKTGIDKKGTPLTSIIATGKSLTLPLLMASFSPAGPLRTAGFIAGMVGSSPLAARSLFKAINWASVADKSPKIKAMINQLGKVATTDAALKLISKIESEAAKSEQ